MSQTVAGDNEGAGGVPPHTPGSKHFQSTVQSSVAGFPCTPFPQGQNGPPYCGPIMQPSCPSKFPNPNVVNGFRPPMQMPPNMHVGPYHPHHPHPQINHPTNQINSMNFIPVNHDSHKVNSSMQNHCNNIQYVPGGNYVATVTVQPQDGQFGHQHIQAQQFNHPNHQFMANQPKYLMNPTMINTMNNVNYMQPNVMVPGYKNFPFPINTFQNSNVSEQIPRPSPSTISTGPKSAESNDASFDEPEATKDNIKTLSESQNVSDFSSTGEPSPTQLSTTSLKANNSLSNTNSPNSRNSSRNSITHITKIVSHNDSDRSETAESSCSSLSTESISEQSHTHNHPFNNQSNFSSVQQFVNSHMQNASNYNNGNMNFPNYVGCQQPGANYGQGKLQVAQQCNQSLVQGFRQVSTVQQVHMQSSQVQVMHQQYHYVQGQPMPMATRIRPSMGILPNGNNPQMNPDFHATNPNLGLTTETLPGDHNSQEKSAMNQSNLPNQFPLQQPLYPGVVEGNQMVLPSHMANSSFIAPPINSGLPQVEQATANKNTFPPVVIVPFGWRRINDSGHIVYISPSGKELRSSSEVTEYLTQEGTCKCGLQCPLRVEDVFCFDAKVAHRLTMPNELSSAEMTKFCNHRKKLACAFSDHLKKQAKKEDGRKKRKRKAPEPNNEDIASFPSKEIVPAPQMQAAPFMCSMPQTPQQHQQMQPAAFVEGAPGHSMHHPQIAHMRPDLQPFQVAGPPHQHQQRGAMHPQMLPPHNWTPMAGMPRMMIPTGCPPQVAYQQMCNPQYNGQQQGCCDNHGCYPGVQGLLPHCSNHHGTSKPFDGTEVPHQQFCHSSSSRDPTMFKPTGNVRQNCGGQHQKIHQFQLQQQQQMMSNPPMMGGNIRPPQHYMGAGPMCRMRCPHTNMNDHPNFPPGAFTPEVISHPKRVGQSKEGEKRRRNTGRGKKRTKAVSASPLPANAASPAPSTPNSSALSENSNSSANLPASSQDVPSFMEDPNGYLAQQTALLNNTMAGGGVGQFSPQAPRASPRSTLPCSLPMDAAVPPLSPKNPVTSRSSAMPGRVVSSSHSSPTIVPLPSNVPLPARVSKANSLPASCAIECAVTTSTTTFCTATCTSVQSKSSYATSFVSTNKMLSINMASSQKKLKREPNSTKDENSTTPDQTLNDLVTVSSCSKSRTSSPQSCVGSSDRHSPSSSSFTKDNLELPFSKSTKSLSANEKLKLLHRRQNNSTLNSTKTEDQDNDAIILEAAANKPLTPGPADAPMSTQSPLEMVQNIVSSIPVPSSEESPPRPHSRPMVSQQGHQSLLSNPLQTGGVTQQMINPQVINMAGAGNMTGVVYNPGTSGSNVLRGTAPLVVHGTVPSVTIPSGVLVNSSGSNNMVVVTSPFTRKENNVSAPVVCSNISGVVGVQAVPQVHVPPLGQVQPQQIQPQLQQIQPVVQLVNTFATMQGPVIIQNGGNIIQSSSGLLPNQSGVIGATGIIPSSGPTFVTNQPIIPAAAAATLSVDSSHTSNLSMTQVVSSASSDLSDDNLSANRTTPVATPATTPTTPLSTPGSSHDETGSHSGSSGGSGSGAKRRRKRRNASTPQNFTQPAPQPAGLLPAFIMGKQISQPMVMNNPQLSPYGSVAGTHIATVAAVGNSPGSTQGGQVLQHAPAQPTNAINVVQMVGGAVAGTLPVHVQQPPAIILPSAAPSGLIINQLPDGTFVSTDPNTGVSYPVQIQISGSQIVGMSPNTNSSNPTGVIGSLAAPSNNTGQMVAMNSVRVSQPNAIVTSATKVINISPTSSSGQLIDTLYDSSRSTGTQVASVCQSGNMNAHQSFGQQTAADAIEGSILVNNANATVVQQKTTIVAQQTTLVAAQAGLLETHSSVSTQTPAGAFGESDVTSSDSVGNPVPEPEFSNSPTHQSAEISTTRRDDDSISPPESLPSTPTQELLPLTKAHVSDGNIPSQIVTGSSEEPHSATIPEAASGRLVVVWAPHRGFPQWPGQLLHQAGGNVLVRWYGDHTVDTISSNSISEFKKEAQKIPRRRSRGRDALEKAIQEANEDLLLPQISPQAAVDEGVFTQAGDEAQTEAASSSSSYGLSGMDSFSDQGASSFTTSSPEYSSTLMSLSPGVSFTQVGSKRRRKL